MKKLFGALLFITYFATVAMEEKANKETLGLSFDRHDGGTISGPGIDALVELSQQGFEGIPPFTKSFVVGERLDEKKVAEYIEQYIYNAGMHSEHWGELGNKPPYSNEQIAPLYKKYIEPRKPWNVLQLPEAIKGSEKPIDYLKIIIHCPPRSMINSMMPLEKLLQQYPNITKDTMIITVDRESRKGPAGISMITNYTDVRNARIYLQLDPDSFEKAESLPFTSRREEFEFFAKALEFKAIQNKIDEGKVLFLYTSKTTNDAVSKKIRDTIPREVSLCSVVHPFFVDNMYQLDNGYGNPENGITAHCSYKGVVTVTEDPRLEEALFGNDHARCFAQKMQNFAKTIVFHNRGNK